MTPCPLNRAGECYCANRVSSFGAGKLPAKTAVLLLAHGSPDNPEQVPEFLNYVTGGRALPSAVVEGIRHRYSLIKFSPLACSTLLQGEQLSQAIQMPVFVGMRNWRPFIGTLPFELDFVEEWHDEALLAKAFAENLLYGWEKADAEYGTKLSIIFTAHSVPERTIADGDPYERQAKETAESVA